MIFPRRTVWRAGVVALALVLILGVAAPYLRADRFGKSVGAALEASLGRKVEIGKVRFDLFRGPGFRLESVVIHEDPAFGIEPLAWVDELEARPSVSALFTGRLEFASLRLRDPVVNLTKTGRWNFERLLDFKVLAAAPSISVRNGRINFKFGDTKSVFYLTGADLDLAAPTVAGGEWRIDLSGEPARTDRPAHGLGTFAGRGAWRSRGGQDTLDLDLELQRSPLGEITALVYGRDIGVHGYISSRLRLKGPAGAVAVAGQLRLEELHRYDQAPLRGPAWPLDFKGVLDLNSQNLDLETLADAKQVTPVSIRFKVAQYLAAEPRWGVNLTWRAFPAEPLIPLARHMGLALPENLKVEGVLDGALGYSGRGRLQGVVSFDKAVLGVAGAAPLKAGPAQVIFDGDQVRLAPARLEAASGDGVTIDAEFRWPERELAVNVASESAGVRTLPLGAIGAPAPLLDALESGTWRGRLRYRRAGTEPGGWTGQVQLRRASAPIPGLADPVLIRAGSVQISGARVVLDKLDASAGKIDFTGAYRYEPETARPHRFQFAAGAIDGEEWERLFRPTLRRGQGFLQRTLGLGTAAVPAWLAARHAEGVLRVEALRLAGAEFTNVSSRLVWDGARVQLLDVSAEAAGGSAAGQGSVSLAGASPGYRLVLKAEGIEYLGGALEGEAEIETAGTGAELLRALKARGRFSAAGLEVGSVGPVRSLAGSFQISSAGVALNELQLKTDSETYTGQGASQKDGRLLLLLSSGERRLRVSGTLAQLRAE